MSDSVQPHRRQPTRLPHPWDSLGKNTGMGCHFLLQCMKVKSQSEVAKSCLTLSDPMDCSLPGSSVHGIFQARVLEWGAIAFSSDPLQLSKSWQNHHIWEVCSANWWDTMKIATPAASIGQQKGPNSSQQCPTTCHTINISKVEQIRPQSFCLICHIHLTSHQPTTTPSSILTTFCRGNASTTSRRQNMLSKSSLNPEAWIFMLQE